MAVKRTKFLVSYETNLSLVTVFVFLHRKSKCVSMAGDLLTHYLAALNHVI